MIDSSKVKPEVEEDYPEPDSWINNRIELPFLKDNGDDGWFKYAVCLRTPERDFHSDDHWEQKRCIAVCATCPVKDRCLRYALVNDLFFGIWGGTNSNERKDMRGRYVR